MHEPSSLIGPSSPLAPTINSRSPQQESKDNPEPEIIQVLEYPRTLHLSRYHTSPSVPPGGGGTRLPAAVQETKRGGSPPIITQRRREAPELDPRAHPPLPRGILHRTAASTINSKAPKKPSITRTAKRAGGKNTHVPGRIPSHLPPPGVRPR